MSILIRILFGLMILLLLNIGGYVLSEDYRFFLKKLKYQDEVVYDTKVEVNDTNRMTIIDVTPQGIIKNQSVQTTGTGFTFLDNQSEKKEVRAEQVLPELTSDRKAFLELFSDYNLIQQLEHSSLFGLTSQYPDPHYEYTSPELTIYVFPTKTYSEVKKIFEVLEFETPFTINETNSFGSASFFINLDERFTDDSVRIVLEQQNATFGLKMKKDVYNDVKQILQTLQ